jgi:cob(I)alamin adenosyltransferase
MINAEKRRKTALVKLQEQLVRGTKPLKINGKTTGNEEPLSDKDIKRIEREIEALNKKLKITI